MRLSNYITEKVGDGTTWIWTNDSEGSTMYLSNPKRGQWYGHDGNFDFDRTTKKAATDQLKKWGYKYIGIGEE